MIACISQLQYPFTFRQTKCLAFQKGAHSTSEGQHLTMLNSLLTFLQDKAMSEPA